MKTEQTTSDIRVLLKPDLSPLELYGMAFGLLGSLEEAETLIDAMEQVCEKHPYLLITAKGHYCPECKLEAAKQCLTDIESIISDINPADINAKDIMAIGSTIAVLRMKEQS